MSLLPGGSRKRVKTIDEVASGLKEGDVIIKGANALDVLRKRAAIIIGNAARRHYRGRAFCGYWTQGLN